MAEEIKRNYNIEEDENNFNLADIWGMIWGYKWWYVLSLAVCLVFAAFYLYRTADTYSRSAKVIIDEDAQDATLRDIANISGFAGQGASVNVNNEVEAFSSPDLMTTVVERLGLETSFTEHQFLRDRELYKAKLDFFTQIAHEIKTPVTLIKSPLEQIIEAGKWDRSVEDNLNLIQKNANRLLDLIHQLLDFRKIESDGYRLKYSSTDVTAIIRDTVSRFEGTVRRKGNADRDGHVFITISYICPEKHIRINADSEALTKILSNLLSNALKYARSEITVSLADIHDRTGRYISIEVKDDGPGIPSEIREKVFEPFFQGAAYSGNGFGIGLSLVKLLAERRG